MGAPQFEQAGADISGTGTTNTIPRWTGPSTLGDSALVQSGTNAVGFGTLKTWGTNFTLNAIQLSESASLSADINTTYLAANQYWDSPGFQNRRIKANFAARYLLNGASGDHQFQIAPFGAADSGITWSTAMTILNTSGNVGIGTASPSYRLHVKDATNRNMVMTSGTTGMKITSLTDAGAEADIGVQGNTVQFLTGGTERARIDSAGSWLVNSTASAGYRARINDSGYGLYVTVGSVASHTPILVENAAGSSTLLKLNATGQLAIGTNAFTTGRALTTVADLDVFGVRVGRGGNTSSTANVCVGATALDSGTAADYVTAIGTQAIQRHNGLDNTAIGYAAHRGSSTLASNTGIRNTALGILSLTAISTGSNNTAVGSRAGDSITTGSSNIIIGSDADLAAATDSNKLVIGDATNYVATNGGATTYYATAGALAGYIIVRLNGTDVKLPVYAL